VDDIIMWNAAEMRRTMTAAGTYDAAIIGAGQAGVPLALSLAGAGWRTALIEREHVGGSCYNEGCAPTKTMIASARVAYLSRRARDYGVVTGEIALDMPAVRQRKRDLVESWRRGKESQLRATRNLDLIMAEAAFTSPRELELRLLDGGRRAIQAARIFINTGARPAIPVLPGLETVPFLTSTSAMELDRVPRRLLVLGGGYVAVEFGQMFRRFGSEVVILQKHHTLLPREDEDVAEGVAGLLREDGVEVVLGAQAHRAKVSRGGRVVLAIETSSPAGSRAGSAASVESISGTNLLVATGRVPNTEALGLPAAGLKVDRGGFIPVNDRLETAVAGIYALGDVKGGPAFTHVSYDDYRVIRTNLLEGGRAVVSDRLVPYAIFTDPQLGRIGLTEREARAQGMDVRVFKMPMAWVARALEVDESRGFMKAVVDRQTDQIVGFAAFGLDGGELMAMAQLAMMGGVTASKLREAVFAHPTLAESFNNLFAG
jgi:pyruvate/2-oxoglutarate dehydrogenase complex dihydrolipoamide dehydrogenase (E3) component